MTERGSAPWFNDIFREAVEHGTELMKSALKPMVDSGHPPLTEKITVADLKKMPPEKAEELLRVELRRTMQTDEMGAQVPHPDTIKLISDFMGSRMEQADGDAIEPVYRD